MANNSFSRSNGEEPLDILVLISSLLNLLLPSPDGVTIEKLMAAEEFLTLLEATTFEVPICSSSECCELSPSDLPQGLRPLLPTASLNS